MKTNTPINKVAICIDDLCVRATGKYARELSNVLAFIGIAIALGLFIKAVLK